MLLIDPLHLRHVFSGLSVHYTCAAILVIRMASYAVSITMCPASLVSVCWGESERAPQEHEVYSSCLFVTHACVLSLIHSFVNNISLHHVLIQHVHQLAEKGYFVSYYAERRQRQSDKSPEESKRVSFRPHWKGNASDIIRLERRASFSNMRARLLHLS